MRRARAVAIVAALGVGLVACSGGSESSGAVSTTAPEQRRSTTAEVADGLAEIVRVSPQVAAAVPDDEEGARELVDQVETAWLLIEGTIKRNDPDAYLSFEEGIARLRKSVREGDPDEASRAVAELTSLTDAYLDQFHR